MKKTMFITVRDVNDHLKLLNIRHIIRVHPKIIKSHKIGEPNRFCTQIESIGAMVSTTMVYESVEQISELIQDASKYVD